MAEEGFALTLRRTDGFQFVVHFDWPEVERLLLDENRPLGEERGPNASRLLAAAVGNCLSASLLFCLQKSRVEVASLETRVQGTMTRNERGRLRIGRLDVTLVLDVAAEDRGRVDRCLGIFEDFCVVTATVRRGLEVVVEVQDPEGEVLLHSSGERS